MPISIVDIFIAILFLVLCVLLINELGKFGTAMRLEKSFQRRLIVLGPHIAIEKERELKAMWALMENMQDYQRINKQLNAMAQSCNLTLPRAFLEIRE